MTVNQTRGLHMTADIVFSLMLSELSELIPHTKSITSQILPKPLSAVPRIVGWLWWVFRDRHHHRHHQQIRSILCMTSELLWLDSWRWNAGRKRSFWGRSYKTHWNITSMLCIYLMNIPLNGVGGKRSLHLKIIWDWGANQRGWQLWRYIFWGIINCQFILIFVNIMHFYLFRNEYSWDI